jgi:hypothetical protein
MGLHQAWPDAEIVGVESGGGGGGGGTQYSIAVQVTSGSTIKTAGTITLTVD